MIDTPRAAEALADPGGPAAVSAWHAELAWLGPGRGVAEQVLIEVDTERITAVTEGVGRGGGDPGSPA